MSRISSPSRSLRRSSALILVGVLLSGCGPSLTDMVTEAMDGCIAARNADFVAGRGAQALDTPLPPAVESTVQRLRYELASEQFMAIAEVAGEQVTLVCALDLASRWNDPQSERFVARYAEHPDAAVASAATRLSTR